LDWQGTAGLSSKPYTCGHCGNQLASERGYYATRNRGGVANLVAYIYVCHHCKKPTFFDETDDQIPGSTFGRAVGHIPEEDVKPLYEEARSCMKVNAYTAAILCCRKLLMNIAVAQDAKEGLHFAEYVTYLADQGYLPPNGKKWVNHIRKKGNEATHEIRIMERADAEELIEFCEMLLRFIYEYPARIEEKVQQAEA
jgi:hypothetical protein